ncbi:MAG: hypothetical protein V4543_17395 [Bacteroidota bacterium]
MIHFKLNISEIHLRFPGFPGIYLFTLVISAFFSPAPAKAQGVNKEYLPDVYFILPRLDNYFKDRSWLSIGATAASVPYNNGVRAFELRGSYQRRSSDHWYYGLETRLGAGLAHGTDKLSNFYLPITPLLGHYGKYEKLELIEEFQLTRTFLLDYNYFSPSFRFAMIYQIDLGNDFALRPGIGIQPSWLFFDKEELNTPYKRFIDISTASFNLGFMPSKKCIITLSAMRNTQYYVQSGSATPDPTDLNIVAMQYGIHFTYMLDKHGIQDKILKNY